MALNLVGTFGKAICALLTAGAVGAVAGGRGTLAAVLFFAGALGGAVGVVTDARIKVLEQRNTSHREAVDHAHAEQDRLALLATTVWGVRSTSHASGN